MHALGIIAEYNPFHNGHAYQAAEARKRGGADIVIAVMSGHFTQRGECAQMDKWHRAEAAVCSGVDLVLELPTVFAVRSAQHFACGGIRLLDRLGIVNQLSFGAENADLEIIRSAAAGMETPAVVEHFKREVQAGKTYAAAVASAIESAGLAPPDFIRSPNNILAVEYLRAIAKYASPLQPLPVKRVGGGYHDLELVESFSSATAIRREIAKQQQLSPALLKTLPPASIALLNDLLSEGAAPADPSRLDNAILAKVRGMSDCELRQAPEMTEGLENRLWKVAQQAGTVPEMLTLLKTKRYPYSRLQRLLVHLLLGATAAQISGFDSCGPLYARVLALNKAGQCALQAISRQGSIPIITKTTAFLNSRTYFAQNFTPLQAMLAVDIAATDLFTLCLPNPEKRKGGLDFCRSAVHSKTCRNQG